MFERSYASCMLIEEIDVDVLIFHWWSTCFVNTFNVILIALKNECKAARCWLSQSICLFLKLMYIYWLDLSQNIFNCLSVCHNVNCVILEEYDARTTLLFSSILIVFHQDQDSICYLLISQTIVQLCSSRFSWISDVNRSVLIWYYALIDRLLQSKSYRLWSSKIYQSDRMCSLHRLKNTLLIDSQSSWQIDLIDSKKKTLSL